MTSPPPPGWYPDPYGNPGLIRWWDGELWTDQTEADEAAGAGEPFGPGEPSGPQEPAPEASAWDAPSSPWSGEHWGGDPDAGQEYTYDDQAETYGASGPLDPYDGSGPQGPYGASGPQDPYGASGPNNPYGAEPVPYTAPPRSYSPPVDPIGGYDPHGPAEPSAGRRLSMPLLFGGIGTLAVLIVAVLVLRFTGVLGGTGGGTPSPTGSAPSPTASAAAPDAANRVNDVSAGISFARPAASWAPMSQMRAIPNEVQWTNGVAAVAQPNVVDGRPWVGNVFTGPVTAAYSGAGDLSKITKPIAQYVQANTYDGVGKKTLQVLDSKSTKVDGHAAWLEKFKFTYDEAGKRKLSFKSETAAVVCIDRPGAKPAALFVTVPDNLDTGIVDRVIASIKVDR